MTTMVGHLVRVALMAALGATGGCLVAVSAFADGPWGDRLITIGAVLLAYGLLGAALGARASGWYGLGLALPGLVALACLGAAGEGRWWYLPYGALLALIAVSAARASAGRRRAGAPPAPPSGRLGDGHHGRAGGGQVEGGRA